MKRRVSTGVTRKEPPRNMREGQHILNTERMLWCPEKVSKYSLYTMFVRTVWTHRSSTPYPRKEFYQEKDSQVRSWRAQRVRTRQTYKREDTAPAVHPDRLHKTAVLAKLIVLRLSFLVSGTEKITVEARGGITWQTNNFILECVLYSIMQAILQLSEMY